MGEPTDLGAVGVIMERSLDPRSFFGLLEAPEREALHALGVPRAFPRGALMMFEREPGERVMILLAGRAKVSRVDREGRELVLSIRDRGDLVGELAFIDGQPRLASVGALEPVEALVIPAHAFRAHLERTPRVAVVLLEVIVRRFRETTLKRAQFAASDTMGRVAARIVELAERYGQPSDAGVMIELPLSREEFAGWAGASRAGVAHALQTLRELGWIETLRGRMVVCDVKALRERAA